MGDNNGNDLNASGAEHRAYPRVAVNIEVSFSSGSELVRSYMSNISNGGMFVETEKPLELGDEVVLNFELPGQYIKIHIVGKVVWNSPVGGTRVPGMGIQFVEMSEESRHILEGYIQAVLAK